MERSAPLRGLITGHWSIISLERRSRLLNGLRRQVAPLPSLAGEVNEALAAAQLISVYILAQKKECLFVVALLSCMETSKSHPMRGWLDRNAR